jgi:hypothetical protein
VDPDPHHFSNLDPHPDPHQKRIKTLPLHLSPNVICTIIIFISSCQGGTVRPDLNGRKVIKYGKKSRVTKGPHVFFKCLNTAFSFLQAFESL